MVAMRRNLMPEQKGLKQPRSINVMSTNQNIMAFCTHKSDQNKVAELPGHRVSVLQDD